MDDIKNTVVTLVDQTHDGVLCVHIHTNIYILNVSHKFGSQGNEHCICRCAYYWKNWFDNKLSFLLINVTNISLIYDLHHL
jgi:hypothetical protein